MGVSVLSLTNSLCDLGQEAPPLLRTQSTRKRKAEHLTDPKGFCQL